MHSKYNPEKEAETFANGITSSFLVIFGVGGGFHIKQVQKLLPATKIIAVEADAESLDFSLSLNNNKAFFEQENISYCTVDNLEKTLKTKYLPALFGDMTILTQRVWQINNTQLLESCHKKIQTALEEIKKDFSVQSHFGKIWHHNILNNLKYHYDKSIFDYKTDTSKQAAIIAAGPSLDHSIRTIDRSSSAIIATDTAIGPLLDHNIEPDIIVSVDSQIISITHYMTIGTKCKNTLFIFDLSAPANLISHLLSQGHKIAFINTGHPLSSLLTDNSLPYITSGAGTVTIAAIATAKFLGFTSIKLYGADFCYNSGKAYTKGTYLERNFYRESNKILPGETLFDKLMFRTPLFVPEKEKLLESELVDPVTSDVMNDYRLSLLNWISTINGTIRNTTITLPYALPSDTKPISTSRIQSNIQRYINSLCKEMDSKELFDNNSIIASLPYIAWCRKYNSDGSTQIQQLINTVYLETKRYNNDYEK